MLTNDQLRERIRRRLAQLGRSPIDAALKAGLARDYIRDFIADPPRKGSVKSEHHAKIAFGLDWEEYELFGTKHRHKVVTNLPSPLVEIPEIDVRAGLAYGGGIAQEELDDEATGTRRDAVRAFWGFPTPFLRDELRIQPSRVHILPVRGDSMRDALFDGDRAIVDLDDTDVSQGGIFAILDDNASVIIKQVELVRGKGERRIRCTSRNPSYQPFELALLEPVRIIGRVAAKLTRL